MKHVYRNGDGEEIAADTLEQAARYHDCELGGAANPNLESWEEVPDDEEIEVEVEPDLLSTKTAAAWAAELDGPNYVSSTYA